MQRYWDLTKQERAALNTEQVQEFLPVQLMEEGAITPVAPALKDVPSVEIEHETVYHVGYDDPTEPSYSRANSFAVYFTCLDDAEAFVDLDPRPMKSEYIGGTSRCYAASASQLRINPVEVCKLHSISAISDTLEKIEVLKKYNEEAQKEYAAVCNKVSTALSGVWEDWEQCLYEQGRAERISATFKDYLDRCDGSEESANFFLLKAYSSDEIDDYRKWLGLAVATPEVSETDASPKPDSDDQPF